MISIVGLTIRLVDAGFPSSCDEENVIRKFSAFIFGAIHSGRSEWHARNGKPHRDRTFAEQALDFLGRHMPLEGVPFYHGRMARAVLLWNAVSATERGSITDVMGDNVESIVLKILDPVFTAAAIRCFPDFDRCSRLCQGPNRSQYERS